MGRGCKIRQFAGDSVVGQAPRPKFGLCEQDARLSQSDDARTRRSTFLCRESHLKRETLVEIFCCKLDLAKSSSESTVQS